MCVCVCRSEGNKGGQKWDNCHSRINKIYLKKKRKRKENHTDCRGLKEVVPDLIMAGGDARGARQSVGCLLSAEQVLSKFKRRGLCHPAPYTITGDVRLKCRRQGNTR